MKFILVWWLIHPGHAQVLHIEKYHDVTACEARANDLLAVGARARCSHI
jgi:hypothetical protein